MARWPSPCTTARRYGDSSSSRSPKRTVSLPPPQTLGSCPQSRPREGGERIGRGGKVTLHRRSRGRCPADVVQETNVVAHLLEERKRRRSPGEEPIGVLAQGHLPMRKGSGGRRDVLVQSLYGAARLRRAEVARARDPCRLLVCPESRGWTTVRHDSSWYWRHKRQCRATLSAFARTRYYELSI